MERVFVVIIVFLMISCNYDISESFDNAKVIKEVECFFSKNEIADNDIIITINGFIDSLDTSKNNINKYYLLSISHNTLGYCYYTKSNFSDAIKEYVNALNYTDKIKEEHTYSKLRGSIYKNIADVFYECENYNLSKELYFKSLEYCMKSSDSNNIVHNYRKIGNICYYLSENENPDTLQYYMQKSMSFVQKEEPLISALYMALTTAFHQKEKIEGLSTNRIKGISLLPDNKVAMNYSLNNYLSMLYYVEGDIDKAIKCSIIALDSDDIKKQMAAHNQLSNLYLISGDTLSSVYHNLKYDSLNYIFSEYKRRASVAENLLYEYEKEKQSIENKNGYRNVFTLISSLAVIMSIFIFIIINRKRKIANSEFFSERWNKFESSEIYVLIKNRCESESDLSAVNVSTSMIRLRENEITNLQKEINISFNDFVNKFRETFPELNKGEIDYCMLSILRISEIHKAALLGLSYQGCVSRKKKVLEKTKMSNVNDDILFLLKNITTT